MQKPFLILASALIMFTSCESANSKSSRGGSLKPEARAQLEREEKIALNSEASSVQFNVSKGNLMLTGEVADNTNLEGRFIKLFETEGRDYFIYDSAKVNQGEFTFDLKGISEGIFKIGPGEDPAALKDIILNPTEGEINIVVNSANFKTASIQGSTENKAYHEYLGASKVHEDKLKAKRSENKDAKIKRQEIYNLQNEFKAIQSGIAALYPNTFFAYMVNHLQSPNRFDKNNYWNDIDFNNTALIRTTVYPDRIEDYMRIHASAERTQNEPLLGFYNAVDRIANMIKEKGSDEVLQFVLYTMSEGFYSSGMEDLSLYVIDNYFYGDGCGDAEISELFKMKAAGIRNLQVGNTAPAFTLETDKGKKADLKTIAANKKLTLVLFWASFCHKCEEEIPFINQLYNNYRNKGFEVVAVSVDTNKKDWLGGIASNGTKWINVAELKGWRGDVAKTYRVTSTPVMFIVDQDLKIVAKPRNANEVSKYLSGI